MLTTNVTIANVFDTHDTTGQVVHITLVI